MYDSDIKRGARVLSPEKLPGAVLIQVIYSVSSWVAPAHTADLVRRSPLLASGKARCVHRLLQAERVASSEAGTALRSVIRRRR